MAYSKDPTAYPPEFAEIFRRATEKSVEIETADLQQATSFRHQLHGYRRAVEISRIPGWSSLRSIMIKIRGSTIILENNNELLAKFRTSATATDPTDKQLDEYMDNLDKEEGT